MQLGLDSLEHLAAGFDQTGVPQGQRHAEFRWVAMNPDSDADFWLELQAIQDESLGWTSLGQGVYLHVCDANATKVQVVR